jgi:hypothetical protein
MQLGRYYAWREFAASGGLIIPDPFDRLRSARQGQHQIADRKCFDGTLAIWACDHCLSKEADGNILCYDAIQVGPSGNAPIIGKQVKSQVRGIAREMVRRRLEGSIRAPVADLPIVITQPAGRPS